MSTTAFLTDSTLCIGCKACEVACKEWNQLGEDGFEWSGNSYDNTMAVGHSTWRHVKFVENTPEIGRGGNSADPVSRFPALFGSLGRVLDAHYTPAPSSP